MFWVLDVSNDGLGDLYFANDLFGELTGLPSNECKNGAISIFNMMDKESFDSYW